MRTFILILVMVTLSNMVKAQSYTVSLKVSDKIEQIAVDNASNVELKALVECVVESGETSLENTACINEVLGDVHN